MASLLDQNTAGSGHVPELSRKLADLILGEMPEQMLVLVQDDGFVAKELHGFGHRLVRQSFRFPPFTDDQVHSFPIGRELKKVLASGNLERPGGFQMGAHQYFQLIKFPVIVQDAEPNLSQPAQLGLLLAQLADVHCSGLGVTHASIVIRGIVIGCVLPPECQPGQTYNGGMKLQQRHSRVPLQLRVDLVAKVWASLKPGMEFTLVYGELLSRLEQAENPSMAQAQALLRNPETLMTEHEQKKANAAKARALLREQIVSANIPKQASDREKVVAETLAFVSRFPALKPSEIKRVTLLRQANGNRDLRTVPFSEVASPESLADDLERAQELDGSPAEAAVHYSASCQTFFLPDNELLPSERTPVSSPSLAEIS